MTVSTFLQPDNTAQVGAVYKGAIDGAIHVHRRIAGAFACHQNDQGSPDAPDLTVRMDAGAIFDGVTLTEVAAQSTSSLTAPVSNPRMDIVYYDRATGAIGVAAGAEAGSPVDPSIPSGKIPVCRINWTAGMGEITNADLDDLRVSSISPIFTGADNGSPDMPGTPGLVPSPNAGYGTRFLREDATWQDVTGEDQTARDMAASALILADYNGTPGTKGAFYLADPFTSDSLGVTTNATYDAAGDYYTNLSQISQATGTADGNMTGGGNVGAAFDGITSQSQGASALRNSASGNTIGKVWSGALTIAAFRINQPNNGVGMLVATGDVTALLMGGASTVGVSGTQLATTTFAAAAGGLQSVNTGIDTSNSYIAHWLELSATSGSQMSIAELEFFQIANMTLRPAATTVLTANPSDVFGYFVIDPVDAVTMGTDVIGRISIDGGSTWATGAWTRVGSILTDYEIWRLDADVDSQTGSSLIWEIATANLKQVRVKQCGGLVPLYS
ncbi:MAG: hypothetical protein KG075_17645 [Alphaproteobacteria bacterium]|nr:hypothetical protein [Alphaproteobacteria bacterium]